MSYRFDSRSEEQFRSDIKSAHLKEMYIAIRLCLHEHHKTGVWPIIKPNGSDFSGEFIKEDRKITSKQDFWIGDKLVEITRADTECSRVFHQKINKVAKCIKDKSEIVFVNGYDKFKQPKYIRLDSDQLEFFTQKSISKYGESIHPGRAGQGTTGKLAYRYDLFWFTEAGLWEDLPVLIDDIPKEYKDLLALTK